MEILIAFLQLVGFLTVLTIFVLCGVTAFGWVLYGASIGIDRICAKPKAGMMSDIFGVIAVWAGTPITGAKQVKAEFFVYPFLIVLAIAIISAWIHTNYRGPDRDETDD